MKRATDDGRGFARLPEKSGCPQVLAHTGPIVAEARRLTSMLGPGDPSSDREVGGKIDCASRRRGIIRLAGQQAAADRQHEGQPSCPAGAQLASSWGPDKILRTGNFPTSAADSCGTVSARPITSTQLSQPPRFQRVFDALPTKGCRHQHVRLQSRKCKQSSNVALRECRPFHSLRLPPSFIMAGHGRPIRRG